MGVLSFVDAVAFDFKACPLYVKLTLALTLFSTLTLLHVSGKPFNKL